MELDCQPASSRSHRGRNDHATACDGHGAHLLLVSVLGDRKAWSDIDESDSLHLLLTTCVQDTTRVCDGTHVGAPPRVSLDQYHASKT